MELGILHFKQIPQGLRTVLGSPAFSNRTAIPCFSQYEKPFLLKLFLRYHLIAVEKMQDGKKKNKQKKTNPAIHYK